MFPIEDFRPTLEKMVSVLKSFSIDFHLTGGITSITYGEPRLTQDVDIVIDNFSANKVCNQFITAIENANFLIDAPGAVKAIENASMFQVLDLDESLKLDIYPRELIPGELTRSETAEIFEGWHLPIVSRADAAGSKLIWISKGSHKSRRDLRKLFAQSSADDRATIQVTAHQLGLSSLLTEVLHESDEIA